MARFLFTVWPLTGHIYPNLTVATLLRDQGHSVAFYSGEPVRAIIERAGLEFLPFAAINGEEYVAMMAAGYHVDNALQRAQRQKQIYRTWLVETLPAQLQDLEQILATWQPDVIVCDPTMWAPFLVLHEKYQIPVAIFSYTMGSFLPRDGMPPVGLGMARPRSRWDRVVATTLGRALSLLTADIRQRANAVRQRHGLPPISHTVTQHAGTMPLYLVTSVPELDYEQQEWPPNVHYVGPCLWTKSAPDPVPEWMEQLRTDQPWVHVSEGTVHSQTPFLLQAAATGLANLPMQVIMATGNHRSPAEMGLDDSAPNVHVVPWVPYDHLLPRTAALVTTGGAGTVMAALQAGVPMVVAPTEWDKPENAQRVVESGTGLRLAPAQCTPERVRAAVQQILNDPAFRVNARRIAARFQAYGGPAQAAELLNTLLPTSEKVPA